jgi:uncharacterized DUF497 family protein
LRFEWDRAKNEVNEAKHGIDFETAQLVFDDAGTQSARPKASSLSSS